MTSDHLSVRLLTAGHFDNARYPYVPVLDLVLNVNWPFTKVFVTNIDPIPACSKPIG
jgi:hypothetical protein